jgi:hypothetical protein
VFDKDTYPCELETNPGTATNMDHASDRNPHMLGIRGLIVERDPIFVMTVEYPFPRITI